MENKEHVSIEMEKLADSLIRDLESLPPSSDGCCIYKVPEGRRHLHPSDYTPKMISIGPFHHGKEEFKTMEEHKQRYLKYFLQRTTVSVLDLLTFMKENEAKLRNSYSETIHLGSDAFVKMVLMDSVFLIELLLRCYDPDLRINDDFWRIMCAEIQDDLLLVENQIPLFILNDLFNLVKTASQGGYYEKFSFFKIACGGWFREGIFGALPIEKKLSKIDHSKAKHFLDMFILCLEQCEACDKYAVKDLTIPSAKELHQAGVKFAPVSSKNPLEIKFNNGVLELPSIGIYPRTELLLRNLLVFESLHYQIFKLNDYFFTMGLLVRSEEDAKLLTENGIIQRLNSDLLPTIMSSLGKDAYFHFCFQYSAVFTQLRAHCKKRRNKWKATLKQSYFNTPWASISVFAAVLLLLLNIIQTVCSIIGLRH